MKFHTTLLKAGKSATGIEVPPEVVAALGTSKKPPVRVTLNGYTYRSTIAVMGGVFMVGVSAENRAGASVAGGDEIDVEIELDTEPRELTIPEDLAAALDADADARRFFDSLSYSSRRRYTRSVEGAKTAETRQRRIEKAVSDLREDKK